MKNEYTILVPDMLPNHFKLMMSYLRTLGYKMELLTNDGQEIIETSLKYVNNDNCFPALLVIGQFLKALNSNKYDINKVALIMFQSGGGCRASNYMSLIRNALKKAGYGFVPVISFNMLGIEKHSGFKLTLKMLNGMLYSVLYADLIMHIANQCKPYEIIKGDTDYLVDLWTDRLGKELGENKRLSYRKIKENYFKILEDFSKIKRQERDTVKVGIVGEIYIKYSPLGNNYLENFLAHENCEIAVHGLMDFCLYNDYNYFMDYKLYGVRLGSYLLYKPIYQFLCSKQCDVIDIIKKHNVFEPFTPFSTLVEFCKDYIGYGAKMGEGWLICAEIIEMIKSGVTNIVCTQPFACLPSHICCKGMFKPIKEKYPNLNIIAIDYDAAASKINQENRLKLMLANAKNIVNI